MYLFRIDLQIEARGDTRTILRRKEAEKSTTVTKKSLKKSIDSQFTFLRNLNYYILLFVFYCASAVRHLIKKR